MIESTFEIMVVNFVKNLSNGGWIVFGLICIPFIEILYRRLIRWDTETDIEHVLTNKFMAFLVVIMFILWSYAVIVCSEILTRHLIIYWKEALMILGVVAIVVIYILINYAWTKSVTKKNRIEYEKKQKRKGRKNSKVNN